ncbi:hypothetical protein T03_6179 [Trichinella britovi]|uniref:Uncharacterized protein n=1 Tax=Trichinella britovi TaxID=45882 RepID=A0A0V1C8U4_TRIBR|nr:hypothetical protein T03_6179 [Trichinella britovi]
MGIHGNVDAAYGPILNRLNFTSTSSTSTESPTSSTSTSTSTSTKASASAGAIIFGWLFFRFL